MRLSNREKMLLGILVGIAFLGGSYFGLIDPQFKKYNEIKAQHDAAEIKYEEFKIALLPNNRIYSNFTVLDNRVRDITALFFPELRQEKFIELLEGHLKKTGIDPKTIQFTKKDGIKIIEDDKSEEQGAAEKLVLQYAGSGILKKKDESVESKEKAELEKVLKDVKMQTISLNFKGSYAELISLIQEIEAYPRRITIVDVSMVKDAVASTKSAAELTTNLTLGYYALPKIHKDQDADFFEWKPRALPVGKKDPFEGASFTNIGPASATQTVATGATNDFFMMLNPIVSDLTTVVISKMGDRSRTTYVYADNAGAEPVTFELLQKQGKYYYRYKTSNSRYPQNYEEPVEILPKSDTFNLQVVSSVRNGADDKSGIALTILNKTDKKLVISVRNDDAKSRITWVKKEGDIQVQ